MIRKAFLEKIFDAANMQRWNDKIRPVELRELDKQAHKMIIAYFLGKFEEEEPGFDWIEIIEGGIFEFLQRLVLTDLKPQVFYMIKEDAEKYKQLNDWIFKKLTPLLSPLGNELFSRFRDYFTGERKSLSRRILEAAHFYATKWEFDIIERMNPKGYEISEIKKRLRDKQEEFYDLRGIQHLALYSKHRNFIDLCGQLRFQIRWSHTHRLPKTSVLGHMLIVALLSYLLSLEINACRKRMINNFFTGLFHDLPEVLTRDIISPVKSSVEGLSDLIKEYEKEQMEKEVYGLIPEEWHEEMRRYTENEFASTIISDGKIEPKSSDEISVSFNEDLYDPRDGEIIKATDILAAFLEAHLALKNGMTSIEMEHSKNNLKNEYRDAVIAGIRFGEIYADFE